MAEFIQEQLNAFKVSQTVSALSISGGSDRFIGFDALRVAIGKDIDEEGRAVQLRQALQEVYPSASVNVDWLNNLIHITQPGV